MSQGIKYTICYKQERDIALEQVKELKETIRRLKAANKAQGKLLNFVTSIAEQKLS